MTWKEFKEAIKFIFTNKNDSIVVDHLIVTPQSINTMTPAETSIYNVSKGNLGKHITLNNEVPPELGCAEAVSFILKHSNIAGIPMGGFAGTASLYEWLTQSAYFERIQAPEQGCIVVSPTGMGNGVVRGHTGILGGFNVQYPNDWGILSNDSQSGLFLELWRLSSWEQYYGDIGQLPVAFFRAK